MKSEITKDEKVAEVFGTGTLPQFEIEVGVENESVGREYSVRLIVNVDGDGELSRCHLKAGLFSECTDEGDLDGLVDAYRKEIEGDFPGSTSKDGSLGKQLSDAAAHAVELAASHDEIPYGK